MSASETKKISVVDGIKKTGMPYMRLGNSGLQISRICLGMMTYGSTKWREWVLEEEEARPFIKRALELGINFFDTADMVRRFSCRSIEFNDWLSLSLSSVFTRCQRRNHWASVEWLGHSRRNCHCNESVPSSARRAQSKGSEPKTYLRSVWSQSETIEHRLYRSLPNPSIRQRNADRGDHGSSARFSSIGKSKVVVLVWVMPSLVFRSVTSALRRCTPGSSPKLNMWPKRMAGRNSSPCRTITT